MEAIDRGERIYTPTRKAAKGLGKSKWGSKLIEEIGKLTNFPKYKHFHDPSRTRVRGRSVHIFYGQGRRM